MYSITQKLRCMKEDLKKLNKEGFPDVHARAAQAYQKFMQLQDLMHSNPANVEVCREEKAVAGEYKRVQDVYPSFLRQKSKAQWIDKGNNNTRLFHQSIRARRCSNKIHSIQDNSGQWVNTREKVNEAFVQFYQSLLGSQMQDSCKVKQVIMEEGPRLNEDQQGLYM